MKIVLASSNKGKIKEIKKYFGENVSPFSDLIEPFEIIENGDSFKANAIIKAKAIQKKLPNDIIIADDSGISVPKLGGIPGIYRPGYQPENRENRFCKNLPRQYFRNQQKHHKGLALCHSGRFDKTNRVFTFHR